MAGRGFRVNFTVPELSEALKQLGAYDGKTAARIEEAVSGSTKAISKGARQRVPVRTGALKKAISSRFDKAKITGYVAAKQRYAHLVEFGAKATTVRAKNASAMQLAQPGASDYGLNEFAGKVDISKRAEQPFMRPAFEQERPNLIKNITQAVKP